MAIETQMYTMCMVQDQDKILLINRPAELGGFPGYLAPGGKVDFPESIVEGAIREVREETGLQVSNLVYKGVDELVNPTDTVRYMVFNYITTTFEGELLQNPPEGELTWVSVADAVKLPMQDWFRRRLPLFFEEGTFEIHSVYDVETKRAGEATIRKT